MRLIADRNGNGKWDTGCYDKDEQAIILNCIKVFHTSGIAKDFIISIITYTFLNSKNSKIFYNVK